MVSFYSNFTINIVAIIRLRQRLEEQQSGEQTDSLVPIKNITLGGILGTIAAFIVSVGAQQRADEGESRIAII